MLNLKTPPMGWNSWNTFGSDINEKMIMETADAMVDLGYKDAGYEYVIIDDCWAEMERDSEGKLVPDHNKFPRGMKYLADYIHQKGLKFGMYSCAGYKTCAGYPSSYGHEFLDAKTFAEWEVDYLKYDFCYFPKSGNNQNAYLTMSLALKLSGRDIVLAACNWGSDDPAKWMNSVGAGTYRSTGDIFDVPKSFTDIFENQWDNCKNVPGCFNDLDMLICGMYGKGHVGVKGCSDMEYTTHFAVWAFMGSPLIMGCDIRNANEFTRNLLQNKELIRINQDSECRPPFRVCNYWEHGYGLARILDNNDYAVLLVNLHDKETKEQVYVTLDDLGFRTASNSEMEIIDVVSGENLGTFNDCLNVMLEKNECRLLRIKVKPANG